MKERNVLDDEAVSPVIATILMVAITVVLAATLYMMLPSGGGGGEQQSGSFGGDDQMVTNREYEVPFAKFSPERSIDELEFTLEAPDNGGEATGTASFTSADLDDNGEGSTTFDTFSTASYSLNYSDQTNNEVINSGDTVVVYNSAGLPDGSYELTVLYDGDEVDSIGWTI